MFGFLSRLFGRQQAEPKTQDEKVDAIFNIVQDIRDELKPMGPTGERMSRLELIVSAVSKMDSGERESLMQELESLEVDDQILTAIEKPKTIEEIARTIDRSYGYTANRLRNLMKQGRTMRKRDAVTRKYVYVCL